MGNCGDWTTVKMQDVFCSVHDQVRFGCMFVFFLVLCRASYAELPLDMQVDTAHGSFTFCGVWLEGDWKRTWPLGVAAET